MNYMWDKERNGGVRECFQGFCPFSRVWNWGEVIRFLLDVITVIENGWYMQVMTMDPCGKQLKMSSGRGAIKNEMYIS